MIALLAGLVGAAHAAEIKLVVPADLATAEGASSAAWPPVVRAQYIYAANQFAALPGGGGYLTSIRWRPDGATIGDPPDWSVDELTITASVTAQAPETMSMEFADNITGPATIVRATAPWQGGTQNLGPAGGPKAFDIDFVLDTPFRYNPAEGNLLLEFAAQGMDGTPTLQDRLAADDQSRAALIVGWTDLNSPTALARVGSMAMELAIVSLPGDYNEDFIVDALDYDTWKIAFGSTVVAYAGADGNGDGIVNAADYTVWRNHFGGSIANGGESIAIPEPAALVLAMIAVVLIPARRRQT